jgi:diaminopimelate decarboxylase
MNADIASQLLIGGVPASDLAAEYGTPLYVYDANSVRAAFTRVRNATPYCPLKMHYACVTNANIAILRLIRALGGGIHANTWGDAVVAMRAGFSPGEIVYSGSNLGPEDMTNLFTHKVAVNLNSLSQLRNYGVHLRNFEGAADGSREVLCRIGLRIHLEDQMPYSRMGVKVAELEEARAIAGEQGLEIVGVHYYRGTGTVGTDHFLKPFPALMEVARRFGDSLQYVDVGGGFGHQYAPNAPIQFDWEHFGTRFAGMMETLAADLGRRITLVLEPGRSLVAESGFLLTRVVGVDRRAAGGQVAGVDTTTSHISSETYRVYGGYRKIVLASRGGEGEPVPTDVVGCTTFSGDYIGRASRGARGDRGLSLTPLREGDLLAVLDAGGYGFAFSSNFLNKPRPAEVLVDQARPSLVRRRETYDDMLRLQVV